MNRPFNLQLFADGDVDPFSALDQLLEGKTPPATDPPVTDPPAPNTDPAPNNNDADDPAAGGDPNLDDPAKKDDPNKTEPKPDPAHDAKINAAMAKLRTEAAQSTKVINELAKALGITETDPAKRAEVLLDLAYKKIAAANNAPVELVKELDQTKEQMQQLQMQQNMITAREKFSSLQQKYNLTQEELVAFANELDAQGIAVVQDPTIDLDYLYYSRHQEALIEKRIQAAVEAALKTSNTAKTNGSTPPPKSSKTDDNVDPPKVNSVNSLDALLAGK